MNSARIAGIPEDVLLQWIRSNLTEKAHILSHGYQGKTFLFKHNDRRLVIKAPMGRGVAWLIRRWMLVNEYRVYQALGDIQGIPKCYGFIQNRYLVLEFVDGKPIRNAQVTDPDSFYRELLQAIQRLHAAGIAHGDLKKKDNTLVVDGRHPCLLDFGVAVIRKKRIAPINHYFFRLFKRFDINAWVKMKYSHGMQEMAPEDRDYYRRTFIEFAASWIKEWYTKTRMFLIGR